MRSLWDKAKAAFGRSLTIFVATLWAAAGELMQRVDQLAALVNDSTFGQQIHNLVGADPAVIGKWLQVVALITIASRLRGVIAAKKAAS